MTERKRTAIVAVVAVLSVILASLGSFAAVITKSGEQVMATIWAEDNRTGYPAQRLQQQDRPEEEDATTSPVSPTSTGKAASTSAGAAQPAGEASSAPKKASGRSQGARPVPASTTAQRVPAASAPTAQSGGTTGSGPSVGLPPKQQLTPPPSSAASSQPVVLRQDQWPRNKCSSSSLGLWDAVVVVEFFDAPANSIYFVQVQMNGVVRGGYLTVGTSGGYGRTVIVFPGPARSCTVVGVTYV